MIFFGGWGGWGDEDDIGFVFNKYGFCVQVYIWIYIYLDDVDVQEEFYSSIWRCHGQKDVNWTYSLCCVFINNAQLLKNLWIFCEI